MRPISDSEIVEFYTALGETLFATQIVEGHLHKLLTTLVDLNGPKVSQSEADGILERYRKLTLGQLIGKARDANFPATVLASLESLNAERRWIVHRLQVAAMDEYRLRTSGEFRSETMSRLAMLTESAHEVSSGLIQHLLAMKRPHENPEFGPNLLRELKKSGLI